MTCQTLLVFGLDLAVQVARLPRGAGHALTLLLQRAGWTWLREGRARRTHTACRTLLCGRHWCVRLTVKAGLTKFLSRCGAGQRLVAPGFWFTDGPTWTYPTLLLRFESERGRVSTLGAGFLCGGFSAHGTVPAARALKLNGVGSS